jgi:hypothetical protein
VSKSLAMLECQSQQFSALAAPIGIGDGPVDAKQMVPCIAVHAPSRF